MENRINIAELLKDCPKGMELYSPIFGNVKLEKVFNNFIYVFDSDELIATFDKKGKYKGIENGECQLFPSKDQRDWSKFQRPFKDGDVAISDMGDIHLLRTKDSSYCAYREDWEILSKFDSTPTTSVKVVRFATEEEKQKLFQAIKDNGYKWNAETKTLEKLHKFKVGDRVKFKINQYEYTIVDIRKDAYIMRYATNEVGYHVPFCEEDNFDLVLQKFDITTLIPFESRVLVRDYDNRIWIPTFWGKRLEDDSNCSYLTTNGCYKYCIPYEGNEHLLGTNNDCDNYYKTW